jgi:hypothetical protein
MQHPLSTKVGTTSPTSGGRSVGIVRLRTKATEFFFFMVKYTWMAHKRRHIKQIENITHIGQKCDCCIQHVDNAKKQTATTIKKTWCKDIAYTFS